jgi:undecaprenyl-diphosphatase
VARRWRLARDLAVAAVGAWFVGRLIGLMVVDQQGLVKSLDAVTRLGETPSFPVVRLAVIVAVISAASPYLTRPTRRVGQLLVLLMALAALYLGTGLPNDVFAAVVLGWGMGAAVHLAFGSPGGRPTRAQVGAALDELGVDVDDVELLHSQPRTGTVMRATGTAGPLRVRVLGRDEADAQLLAKFWRWLFYKDGGPSLHLTRLEDVEHEAYTYLVAERAAVRVPEVVVAGTAGPGTALIAVRDAAGTRLADVGVDGVTDDVLHDLWDNVGKLHATRLAHGRLNAHHALVAGDRVTLLDFDRASAGANDMRRSADVAELLVSTAGIVGTRCAVDAATGALGPQAVADALPLLQTAALSNESRPHGPHARSELKKTLDELRTMIAEAAGVEAPALQQLARVDTTNLLMAVGTLIAVFALLGQIGDPDQFWDTITSANVWWLVVALLISFSTNIATAVALMGTVPIPLPLWRTSELQLSMSFSNLAVPAVGGMAAQIRFLQKQGVDLASAVASGGVLMNAANVFTCVLLLAVAVVLSPTDIHTGTIPTSELVDVVVLVVVVLAIILALIWFIPKLRNLVMPQVTGAVTTIWHALRSPRRVFELIGGNAINAMLYALVMLACLEAFGGSLNYWTILALNIIVGTIASLVPIPGGGTAVGSVGMSGALTAAGVPTEIAVAAVLANQLVANFIPAVPGWFATHDLLDRDYL